MKKIVFLLFFISLISMVLDNPTTMVWGKEPHYLKLKASRHPEFLRIVLEGTDSIITNAIVNQKNKDILIRFPDSHFTVQAEKEQINYKISKDAVLLSPGDFSRFKVFSLKDPSRLVIDIFFSSSEPSVKSQPTSESTHIHRIKTVVIDPGHGGYNHGIIAGDYKEKNEILDIAKRLKALIIRDNARCFLTRESDQFISLKERVDFANKRDTEIFLSLHIGKHSDIVMYSPVITEPVHPYIKAFLINKGQEGFMTKTAALRNAIQKAITEDFGADMVTVKPLPYSFLSNIEAAALIIELPSFESVSYVAEFKTKVADTIYKGLYLYEKVAAN